MNATVEQIWHDFSQKLRGFISARVNDPNAAEDILHDVFLRVHSQLNTLRDPTTLTSWIYLIARNAIIDYYRIRKRTVEVPESLVADGEPTTSECEGLTSAFRRMIASLPEPYREALVLTELDGLTQKELASRVGITLSGAKARVQRARQKLKQMLTDCCSFEFDRRGQILDCTPNSPTNCRECR